MSRRVPRFSHLAWLAGALAVALLLAILPLGIGLPSWSAVVAGGWLGRRQGRDRLADRLVWSAQAGMPGLAVEIGRTVGHGAVGVLCGLLSVLLQATVLAMLFPPPRAPSSAAETLPDWDPQAAIGPGGASYVLQLTASPAVSAGAPRMIPGLEPSTAFWLWPEGWLLPAGGMAPEQDAADRYAVLAGHEHGVAGLWLLELRQARVYWLARCQLAGWRDGRPWLEPLGGGRLLAAEDVVRSFEPCQVERRGGLRDVAQRLPGSPVPPEVVAAAEGMPSVTLQSEWPPDALRAADPMAAIRHPRFRLWIDDRDTGLAVAAGDPAALRWQADQARLLIRARDASGVAQSWCWQPVAGLLRWPVEAGQVRA